MQLETENCSAVVRNLYHIAHIVTGTSSFGGIGWRDSNKLCCFLFAFQSWNGPAIGVFAQRTAGEAHYQEQ